MCAGVCQAAPRRASAPCPSLRLASYTHATQGRTDLSQAVQRAHKTIRHLSWFQIVETRGHLKKGKVDQWQLTVKVGFQVEG